MHIKTRTNTDIGDLAALKRLLRTVYTFELNFVNQFCETGKYTEMQTSHVD